MAAEYRICWVLVCDACRAELQDPESVDTGHVKIQEHHVRPQPLHLPQRREAVLCFADNQDVAGFVQMPLHSLAKRRRVVNDQYFHRVGWRIRHALTL